MYTRNQTRVISIGDVKIGGGNPVAIQSMTNTKTENVEETVKQILALEKAGCQIIRCTVPTMKAAEAFTEIKKQIHIPLVADIHFDYKLAIAAMEHGADKIRINPGNIGGEENIRKVVETAKKYHVPIRVGVNSGSLEKPLVKKYNGVTAQGLVESALDKVAMLEKYDFHDMVVSIKSSDVLMCAEAYRLVADKINYPLHVGITEAGTVFSGNIKSAVGLGIILNQGIGDTIRVSLTGDPVSRITIAVSGDDMILKQIKNQLSKLEDVVKIFELENSKSVCRELILAKIRANKTEKQEVITIADIFRAKVVDVSKDNLMIELTGNVNKIEAFINLISDFGVIEIVRTGITGLSRGEDNSNIF